MNFLKNFSGSIAFAIVALIASFFWGLLHGPDAGLSSAFSILAITSILAVMEVSLSLDNAVVNASVLKHLNAFWQKMFLTVGILIAVFGMRLLFPLLIVAVTADMGILEVANMALNEPLEYATKLAEDYASIAAFGGIFLWLVFADFFFSTEQEVKWITPLETVMQHLGGISKWVLTALLLCFVVVTLPDPNMSKSVLIAGVLGALVYTGIQLLGTVLEYFSSDSGNAKLATGAVKTGLGGFLYLELLDASLSLDGVLSAFVITSDITVIMIGLAIGAFFVRSLTVYLVNKGTLNEYRFLEHGAMYSIGALSLIMLLSSNFHIPEVITGLIGVFFIAAALLHSIYLNKKEV